MRSRTGSARLLLPRPRSLFARGHDSCSSAWTSCPLVESWSLKGSRRLWICGDSSSSTTWSPSECNRNEDCWSDIVHSRSCLHCNGAIQLSATSLVAEKLEYPALAAGSLTNRWDRRAKVSETYLFLMTSIARLVGTRAGRDRVKAIAKALDLICLRIVLPRSEHGY